MNFFTYTSLEDAMRVIADLDPPTSRDLRGALLRIVFDRCMADDRERNAIAWHSLSSVDLMEIVKYLAKQEPR